MNLNNIQLLVRMNEKIQHAGGGYPALEYGVVYRADFATNQPNWLAEQKVFVHPTNGPEILLAVTDGSFTVIGFALHSDIEAENKAIAQEEKKLCAAMERSVMRQNRSGQE